MGLLREPSRTFVWSSNIESVRITGEEHVHHLTVGRPGAELLHLAQLGLEVGVHPGQHLVSTTRRIRFRVSSEVRLTWISFRWWRRCWRRWPPWLQMCCSAAVYLERWWLQTGTWTGLVLARSQGVGGTLGDGWWDTAHGHTHPAPSPQTSGPGYVISKLSTRHCTVFVKTVWWHCIGPGPWSTRWVVLRWWGCGWE